MIKTGISSCSKCKCLDGPHESLRQIFFFIAHHVCFSCVTSPDTDHQPTIRVDPHIKADALTASQPLDEVLALPTALRALGSLALCSHASVLPVLMRDNQVCDEAAAEQ